MLKIHHTKKLILMCNSTFLMQTSKVIELLDWLHHNYYRVSCFLSSCHVERERERWVCKIYRREWQELVEYTVVCDCLFHVPHGYFYLMRKDSGSALPRENEAETTCLALSYYGLHFLTLSLLRLWWSGWDERQWEVHLQLAKPPGQSCRNILPAVSTSTRNVINDMDKVKLHNYLMVKITVRLLYS